MLRSFSPADGTLVGELTAASQEHLQAAVRRARGAQNAWAELGLAKRVQLLREAGALAEARAKDMGALASREMGKPIREAVGEAVYAASLFASDLDEMAEAFADDRLDDGEVHTVRARDPLGVVACIAPWNFPVLMPHQQILPALAAGNTVVFKPSEETPLTGQMYADCLLEVLPENVLQVVHGGRDVGKALVQADVDLVVFTGSRAAGIHILGEASKDLKRVVLELGGKDPLVVTSTADVAKAAKFACRNSFRNAGQVCVSTERIYVHASVYDDFVAGLVDAAGKMTVGAPDEKGTRVGPMVHARQKELVEKQLDDAIAKGANVAFRGDKNDGNYLSPVVLTDVCDDMSIMTDETFGPVACVVKVDSDDEAIAQANNTPYGLGAVLFGEGDAAFALARRLTAGMVGVNQGVDGAQGSPWVGARQSGYGFHSGIEGHRQFAQTRIISRASTSTDSGAKA